MADQTRSFGKSLISAHEVDWEVAYRSDLPRIYNFFRYRVGNNLVAQDLTAETFAKAWQNRGRYRNDLSAFSTWLFTIAKHVAVDYFRRPRREVALEAASHVMNDETVETLIQQRSDFQRLSTLLSRLPDKDRELVALKYGAGLTNRAIALLNGVSESSVGNTLYRVTRQLRAAWEEQP